MASNPPSDKGYEAERWRASQVLIEQSMNRRLGRLDPTDVGSLPVRSDSQYDPRKW